MKSPGWDGFFMGMALPPYVLVVIFQISVTDFVLCCVDAKSQTAVTGDTEAPRALSVPCQRVGSPGRERPSFLRVLHIIQESQHLAEFVHRAGRNTFRVVLRSEEHTSELQSLRHLV